ncbi:hypothetical protein V6N13_017687 [Hibiscus sabdariffa]
MTPYMSVAKLVFFCLVLVDVLLVHVVVAEIADVNEKRPEIKVHEQDRPGWAIAREADEPAASPESSYNETREAEAPEIRRLGKHRASDGSAAGGGVIVGGLATVVFVAIFAYIREIAGLDFNVLHLTVSVLLAFPGISTALRSLPRDESLSTALLFWTPPFVASASALLEKVVGLHMSYSASEAHLQGTCLFACECIADAECFVPGGVLEVSEGMRVDDQRSYDCCIEYVRIEEVCVRWNIESFRIG